MPNLSSDREVIDARMTAHQVAFWTLVRCLEDSGALRPGHYADVLHMGMETRRRELWDMTLAMLYCIRKAVIK